MRTTSISSVLFACIAFGLASCNDEPSNDSSSVSYPNQAIQKTFAQKYPTATDIDFDSEGAYYVADFKNNTVSTSAWFDTNGTWLMQKADVGFDQLPRLVITAFSQSGYVGWKVDEADQIERLDMGTVYKIEVKSGTSDTNLYYTPYGDLMKATDDALTNDAPILVPTAVKDLMSLTFSSCQLLDIETNSKGYVLSLVDTAQENRYKTAQLNSNYNWQSTSWQVSMKDVPGVVRHAFDASEYANNAIEEIRTLLNANGTFYQFVVQQGGQNVTVTFDVSGNQLKAGAVL